MVLIASTPAPLPDQTVAQGCIIDASQAIRPMCPTRRLQPPPLQRRISQRPQAGVISSFGQAQALRYACNPKPGIRADRPPNRVNGARAIHRPSGKRVTAKVPRSDLCSAAVPKSTRGCAQATAPSQKYKGLCASNSPPGFTLNFSLVAPHRKALEPFRSGIGLRPAPPAMRQGNVKLAVVLPPAVSTGNTVCLSANPGRLARRV